MALDFPSSPTDGQIYDNYYWDNTNSVWRLLGDSLEVVADFSNTATGTYTDGFDYKYVSFTADGTLTVTRGGLLEFVIVGGGGASFEDNGTGQTSGGGAGGYISSVAGETSGGGVASIGPQYFQAGSYTVKVGAGGVASSGTGGNGANIAKMGSPSVLGGFTAFGGGCGAQVDENYPATGGSGGGNDDNQIPGNGTYGQGFAGESGTTSGGGGGGGAGQAGGTNGAGRGGDGVQTSITGTPTYFAGGGSWGDTDLTAALGGGGIRNTAGTPNTGGGAGGNNSANGGRDGGSGIVIVRVRTN